MDSKVVQFISSIQVSGVTIVQRRCGANILNVSCPRSINYYVENMGGVDQMIRSEQMVVDLLPNATSKSGSKREKWQ